MDLFTALKEFCASRQMLLDDRADAEISIPVKNAENGDSDLLIVPILFLR
jgi:hypothetical protein